MVRCLNPAQVRHHHTWNWGRGGMGVLLLGVMLVGCGVGRGDEADGSGGAAAAVMFLSLPNPADDLQQAAQATHSQERQWTVPENATTVMVYRLMSDCEGYQPEPVQVAEAEALDQTVALILAEQQFPEFTLSGYRVTVDPDTKTATIDLRVARTSRRVLNSLSLCEQKAMLGSLKETLVNHPDWGVEAVDFTNRGNRLIL